MNAASAGKMFLKLTFMAAISSTPVSIASRRMKQSEREPQLVGCIQPTDRTGRFQNR